METPDDVVFVLPNKTGWALDRSNLLASAKLLMACTQRDLETSGASDVRPRCIGAAPLFGER